VIEAAKWILTGYFFKLYVANNLNTMTAYMDFPFYETVQTQDKCCSLSSIATRYYADFFGYSSIAIGLGLLFGYRLPVNFNLPYIAASFSSSGRAGTSPCRAGFAPTFTSAWRQPARRI